MQRLISCPKIPVSIWQTILNGIHECWQPLYIRHDGLLSASGRGVRGGNLKRSKHFFLLNAQRAKKGERTYASKYPIDLRQTDLPIDDLYWDGTNYKGNFVYILISNGNPVYVGETTRLMARMGEHSASRTFNKVLIVPLPHDYTKKDRCAIEKRFQSAIPS